MLSTLQNWGCEIFVVDIGRKQRVFSEVGSQTSAYAQYHHNCRLSTFSILSFHFQFSVDDQFRVAHCVAESSVVAKGSLRHPKDVATQLLLKMFVIMPFILVCSLMAESG